MKNPFKSFVRFVISEYLNQSSKKQEERDKKNGFIMSDDSELNENYLFDFKLGYNQNANNFVGGGVFVADAPMQSGSGEKKVLPPQKIKVKPVDVLNELEKIPTPFSLANLDDKISVLKDKAELIKQKYSKREVKALIERLENRKGYTERKIFFDQFQNTNEEAIDTLLQKYALVMQTSDLFIPEFPDEAIKIMKEYTEKVKEISGKEPVYYVIAEEKDFKKKYEKRDPILLAQSPFGFYYQVLGAWDKEMLLLSEL